jgi:hypothetical protein
VGAVWSRLLTFVGVIHYAVRDFGAAAVEQGGFGLIALSGQLMSSEATSESPTPAD